MKTALLLTAVSAASLNPCALVAQGLLYSTQNAETSSQCPALPAISTVAVNDIEHVVPAMPPALPAAFQTRQAAEVMWGDQNSNGSHYEPGLFGKVDAILRPVMVGGGAMRRNARNVWFSPSAPTTALFGAPMLRPTELGRMRPNGLLERFLTQAQVYAAFGLAAGAQENVDAATLIWGVGLFLSFETGVNINTLYNGAVPAVPDGSILVIPFAAIAWGASPYDGAAVVTNVVPGSGMLVLTEAEVNAHVAASGIRDHAGNPVVTISDLDGLEPDPMGGVFVSQGLLQSQFFPNGQVPNLIFCGINLTGGGIVSTSGNIAVINGVPMGNAVATTGAEVGLITPGGVGSLNGLGLTNVGQYRFVTQCTEQLLALPGVVNIEVASEPGGLVVLALQFPAVAGVGTLDPSLALPFLGFGFPDLYALTPAPFPGPVPGGCSAFNLPVPAGLAGTRALFQGAHLTAGGGLALSTPSAVQFY